MYSLLNSKFNTCPSSLFFPSSLQFDSRDSRNCSSGTPLMDCTATETRSIQEERMSEVVTVKLSPNRSNIMYVERRRTDLETDF